MGVGNPGSHRLGVAVGHPLREQIIRRSDLTARFSPQRRLADYERGDSLVNRMRNRRFEQFRVLLDQVPRPLRILDIGGYEGYWQQRGMAEDPEVDITVLNLELPVTSASNIHGAKGDATDLAEYADDAFDVVHSNSVMEHLGTESNQERMAAEVQRVGGRYFVQTPAKYFPVEPHVLLPAFEYLPRSLKARVLTGTQWSKLGRLSDDEAADLLAELRLLSRRDFQRLFPGGHLIVERFAGLAKSFTVHNFS